MATTKTVRNLCFTLNNYTEEELDDIKKLVVAYMVIGKEVGESGTPHLQGYIEFKNSMRWETIKKRMPRAHLEKRKGTAQQASDYCKKDGDFTEVGELSQQGARTDLADLVNQISAGELTVQDVVLSNPIAFHQYGRTLNRVEDIALRARFRDWMTEGVWYFGPTGCGKSHRAFEGRFDPTKHYVWKDEVSGWQDGYTGQETVIVNEFRGGIKYAQLLELVDRWPTTLNRRGREPVPFLARKLVVTSSLPPEEVYKTLSQQDSLAQLYRRFKVWRCVDHHTEVEHHAPEVAEVVPGNTRTGTIPENLREALKFNQ